MSPKGTFEPDPGWDGIRAKLADLGLYDYVIDEIIAQRQLDTTPGQILAHIKYIENRNGIGAGYYANTFRDPYHPFHVAEPQQDVAASWIAAGALS